MPLIAIQVIHEKKNTITSTYKNRKNNHVWEKKQYLPSKFCRIVYGTYLCMCLLNIRSASGGTYYIED